MSGRLFAAARTLALASVAAPTLVAAQQSAVGTNSAVRNMVQIRRGAAAPQPAVVRQRVLLNDEVGTGAASQLQILLLDRSTFTVGANARLKIDRFVYDPNRNARAIGATVTRGAFRFMSGSGLRRAAGPVAVRTPVASIGIRGTIFEGVVGQDAVGIASAEPAVGAAVRSDPSKASLMILRGPGPRTQGATSPGAIDVTAGGKTVTLDRPRLAVYVPRPGAAPIGPFELSEPGLRSMQQLLRTVPAGALASFAGPGAASGQGPGTGAGPAGAAGQPGRAGAGSAGAGASRPSWLFPGVGIVAGALAAVFALTRNSNQEKTPISP